MSEDEKLPENNVSYWSPPLPWLAPRRIAREESKEEIEEIDIKAEKVKDKD